MLFLFLCICFLVDCEEGKESFYTFATNRSHTPPPKKTTKNSEDLKILEPVEKPQVFKCRKS